MGYERKGRLGFYGSKVSNLVLLPSLDFEIMGLTFESIMNLQLFIFLYSLFLRLNSLGSILSISLVHLSIVVLVSVLRGFGFPFRFLGFVSW